MKNLAITAALVLIASFGPATAQQAGATLAGPSVATDAPVSGLLSPVTASEVQSLAPSMDSKLSVAAEAYPELPEVGPVPAPKPLARKADAGKQELINLAQQSFTPQAQPAKADASNCARTGIFKELLTGARFDCTQPARRTQQHANNGRTLLCRVGAPDCPPM